jgi:hypothetical protein
MVRKGVEYFFTNDNMESLNENVVQDQSDHRQFISDFRSTEEDSADIAYIPDMGMSTLVVYCVETYAMQNCQHTYEVYNTMTAIPSVMRTPPTYPKTLKLQGKDMIARL